MLNLFVFGDFNVCHKDWLAYSGAADRPGEVLFFVKVKVAFLFSQ